MKYATWLSASKNSWRWYFLAGCLVLADQLTKSMASQHLGYGQPLYLAPFLNFTLLHNTGAAFSFLSDAGGWQRWAFSALSTGMSLLLICWLPMQRRVVTKVSFSLILAGAVGNLYDRINLGYVVDFISLHYAGWYWPAFNLADSCISIGAVLLVLEWFVEAQSSQHD